MTIRRERKGRRLTLGEIARAVGISVPYLSQLENGFRQPPRGEVVDALADALALDRHNLQQAAEESRSALVLSLKGASPKSRELAVLLHRKLEDGMSDTEVDTLLRKLGGEE